MKQDQQSEEIDLLYLSHLGMAYSEALAHQMNCEYRLYFCPHGCGKKLLMRDIKEHEKSECPNVRQFCPNCELHFLPDRTGANPHDCLEELVRQNESTEGELKKLEFSLGVDYERVRLTCPKGKPLAVHSGNVYPYISRERNMKPQCDECSVQGLHLQEFFYRCSQSVDC